jgi:LacI family transcriptional regulator
MHPEKPVTLQTIADKANVSRATVSMALRNQLNLPWQTRKKIQDIAKKLGYKPSPIISQLMRYRRAGKPYRSNLTLAYIKDVMPVSRSYIGKILQDEAEKSAEKNGYQLECFWLQGKEGKPSEKLSDLLHHRNIHGLILAPFQKPIALAFEWENFSTVTMGYSLKPRFHRIVSHYFQGMKVAARNLSRFGYQRWGYAVSPQLEANNDHQWIASFLYEQKALKPENRIPICAEKNEEWNEDYFRNWVKKYTPDVIIGVHRPLRSWIEHLNLKIPTDVGFLNLYADSEPTSPSSGIDQHPEARAAAAIDLVVAMIQRQERGIPSIPQIISIEGRWVNGPTLRQQT